MVKKFALGLHHLNVAYTAGDESSYHRQIREGIVHLFNLLDRHPTWCFSTEMSGFSIEYIANNYPPILDRLKTLIKRNQIELISSSYSPQIWIAFPKIDLIKSIEINADLFTQYQLKPSRIFFAQENFFGPGVKKLAKWFDTAIVKDDYYFHKCGLPKDVSIEPYYMLDEIKLIVGWGHMLENISRELSLDTGAESQILKFHNKELLLESSKKIEDKKRLSRYVGRYDSFEWDWYHIGSSERFAKPYMRPENIDLCRFDPEWFFYFEKYLTSYEEQGYSFTSISDFLKAVSESNFEAKPCVDLLDGAWNMEGCKGGFIWMGFNSNDYEDDLMVRNHNWRSRARLVALETLLEQKRVPEDSLDDIKEEMSKAWKHQIMAEVSDATGWYPDLSEVYYSIEQSESVLNIVSQIVNFIKQDSRCGVYIIDCLKKLIYTDYYQHAKIITEITATDVKLLPALFGASGEMKFFQVDATTQRIIVDFMPEQNYCGIKFAFELDHILYSPALMDDEVISYNLNSFDPKKIYIPLPNGLIKVNHSTYIIKHNEFMNISCCIDTELSSISFHMENPKKRLTRWVITIFVGNVETALSLANSINIYPTVCL